MTCEVCRKKVVGTIAVESGGSVYGHRFARYAHHRIEQVLTASEGIAPADLSAMFHQVGIE